MSAQKLLIAVDISGGMPERLKGKMLRQIETLRDATQSSMHFLTFEQKVQSSFPLTDDVLKAQILTEILPSWGGTDFDCIFEEAAKIGATNIAIFTDLLAPTENNPDIPVTWYIDENQEYSVSAKHGTIIKY